MRLTARASLATGSVVACLSLLSCFAVSPTAMAAPPRWVQAWSGTSATLRDVALASDGRFGLAVGDGGAVVRTTCGGGYWKQMSLAAPIPAKPLFGVALTGAAKHRAVAVGAGGTILLYDDALGWRQVSSPTTVDLRDVDFTGTFEHNVGCAVGLGGVVLRTTDGGNTWIIGSAGEGNDLQAIDFVDANHAWTTGGTPWSTFRTEGQSVIIATSADAGASWQTQLSEQSGPFLPLDIAFATPLVGWVVGSNGGVYTTTTGGLFGWSAGGATGAGTLFAAAAIDRTTCWAVGANGVVERTTGAGLTWTMVPSTTIFNLYGVAFAGSKLGVAVGAPAPARAAMIAWDAAAPKLSASGGSVGQRGRPVTLKLSPFSASFNLRVGASIVSASGHTVLRWPSFAWHAGYVCPLKFRCSLAAGTYRWQVTVQDAAGYRATLTRRLTVR